MTGRESLFAQIDETFSAEAARDFAVELTNFYRTPGTSGYTRSIDRVVEELSVDGLEVTVDAPTLEDAWEPHAASLRIVEPDPVELASFEESSPSLVWGSTPTDGPVEVELVDVGTGENAADFEGVDLEGKAAFIHGTERRPGWWEAAQYAVENGAVGLVTDYMLYQTPDVRTPELVPDATQFLRLRPPEFFQEESVWAFSVSHERATDLLDRLDEGPVTVEATVDATEADSELPMVEATIPGTELPEETILFCGHASGIKPGANCAEGTGLVVELARALARGIEAGHLPQPRRSITFIIGAEGAVSEQYLETNDNVDDILVAFSYCSTGHDQSKTASCLMLSQVPDSTPSYVNDHLDELQDLVPKEADWIGKHGDRGLPLLSMKRHYYTPWSDNVQFAGTGIPAPLFMSWPDRCFHSHLLTPDVIDVGALRRTGRISGVAGIELACADLSTASSIAGLVAGRSLERVHRLHSRYATEPAVESRARRHLEYVGARDTAALESVHELTTDPEIDAIIEEYAADIAGATTDASNALGLESVADADERDPRFDAVPVRTTDGLAARWAGLSYEDLLEIADDLEAGDETAGWRSMRVVADEAWNFVDGDRTVAEIADAVGFEFDLVIDPDPIDALLRGHEEVGNLRFEE